MKKYACAACPFKLPIPLSDRYIFNHLAGKDAAGCDVVGLYPLMEGDVCRFLAFDFDSHTGSSVKTLSEKAVQTCCVELVKVVHNFLSNDCDSENVLKPAAAKAFEPPQNIQLTQKDFSSVVHITNYRLKKPRRARRPTR